MILPLMNLSDRSDGSARFPAMENDRIYPNAIATNHRGVTPPYTSTFSSASVQRVLQERLCAAIARVKQQTALLQEYRSSHVEPLLEVARDPKKSATEPPSDGRTCVTAIQAMRAALPGPSDGGSCALVEHGNVAAFLGCILQTTRQPTSARELLNWRPTWTTPDRTQKAVTV